MSLPILPLLLILVMGYILLRARECSPHEVQLYSEHLAIHDFLTRVHYLSWC